MNTYFIAIDDELDEVIRVEAATPQAAVEAALDGAGYDPIDLEYIVFTVHEPKVNVKRFLIDMSPRVVEIK